MTKLPVYIFNGLLEGGKTTFIKEILADPNFTEGERSLLLRFEDGIEEFDAAFLDKYNTQMVAFEDEDEVTTAALKKAALDTKPDRILVEFNGMWDLDRFINELMPAGWELYQIVAAIDGPSYKLYSANLGPQMFSIITTADLIVFNRCTQADKDYLHERNIRAMNPRATIFLDDVDGGSEDYRDNMIMPFDLDADIVEIKDEDFGLWYVDATSDFAKYNGKTVRFKGMAYKGGKTKLPKGMFVPGRMAMVCCADDISFVGFACKNADTDKLTERSWYTVTAKIQIENLSFYRGEGPVLYPISIEPAEAPAEEIVYFN